MTELKGESVLFLRVRPGYIDKAMSDLRNIPGVSNVGKLLGPWDLIISGSFPDYQSLTSFAGDIESKPYCIECRTYPNFGGWKREESPRTPTTGWAMIRTSNVDEVFNRLKEYQQVYWLMTTSGEYNVIAHVGGKEIKDLSNFVISNVHNLPGVKSTETLPSP